MGQWTMRRHRAGRWVRVALAAALLVGCGDTGDKADADDDVDASELGGVGVGAGGGDDGGTDSTGGTDGGGGGSTVGAALGEAFEEGAWTLNHWELPWEAGGELGYLVSELVYQQPVFGAGELGGGREVSLQAGLLDSRGGAQDTCVPTDTLTGTLDADGVLFVETPLATLPAPEYGLEIHLVDASFRGTLDPETGRLDDLAMSATWDARLDADDFAVLVGTSSPDELCSFVASFGGRCDACEDGEFYCVDLAFGDTDTQPIDGPVVPVEETCR